MATTQHYLWASGHFLLLLASLRYVLAWITFKTVSAAWYKASFTGALISYAIVCHKSLGTPQPNLTYIRRALVDENVQYFLLAFFWWTSQPITITLFPYMIFSLFHALTFTRTTLMTQFLPPSPPATAGGAPQPHPLAKKLQAWVKTNYDSAMRVVAYTELLILARVFLGALTFQNSLLTPIVFANFLKQRYFQSPFTREAVADVNARLDKLIRKPGNPPVVGQVWDKVQMLVERWGNSSVMQGAGPAPAPAGARR